MIVCQNCGAEDDEAVNMDWTLSYRRGYVTNAVCLVCGGPNLVSLFFVKIVIIEEEWDD